MSSDASGSNNEHQDSKTNDDSCVQESTIAVAQALQSHYDGASGAGDGSIDASESSLTPKGQDIADKTVDGSGDTSKIDISNPENQTKDTTNPYNDELKCASHAQDQVYHENIVNIDMKTVSNKFLEPVSGSASPKTPISTDEDLVLKWDDDEESEEQNTGEEKIKGDDDNAETNYFNLHDSDEKKQATLNTSDELMEQIDQQISELDTKNIDSKNDDQTGIVEISSDILNEINDTASEKELKSSETSSTIESTGKFKSDFMELDDDTDLDINTKSVDKLIDKLETVISEQSDIDRTDSLSNKNMDKETTDVQKKCESLPVMEESADTTITSIESKVESEIQDIPEQTLDTVDHSAEAPEVVESMDVDKKETTFKDNFNITDDKAAANSTALDVDNTIEELSETIHSSDETLIEPREHNLNKTDVMLDIPTQELIECMDESVELSKIDNTTHMEVSQTAQIALKNEVDVSITEEKVEESTDGSKLDPKNIMDIEINSKSVTENSETKTSEVVNSAISEEVLLSEQKMNVDDIGNKTTTEETCRKITEQSSTKVQALNSDETTNECEPCKQSDKGNSEDIPDKETAKSHETVIEKPTECEPCKPSDECNSESIPAIETAKSHKTVIENPTSESDNQAIPQIISSELDNHALEKEDHSTDQHISETIANRSDPKVIETITEKSDSNEVTTFDDASFQETSPKIVPSTPITEENKTLSTDVIVTDKKESKSNEQCSLTVTDGIAKEAETKDSPIEAMKGTTEMPSTITVPINREGEEKTSEIQTLEVKEIMEQPSTNTIPQTTETEEKTIKETSQMEADTSEDVLEVTDSLGLLAESSRVVEDDEEQETSDHDEVDDDDDFDPDDESSNQMTTAEMSEDSNAQLFESDLPKVEVMDTIPDDNAQDYLEKDMGTPPDGLGIPPDELGTTPADTVDTADSANLETDIDEPNIEDFINKVDEISEVDADMLDEVEGLSPTDVQSPSADNLAEDDKGCAFAISNVVSETEATKDVGGSENIDKDIDEKLAKESPVAAKTVKTIITTEAEDKAKKDDAAKDSPVESKPPGGETQLLRKLLANEIAPKKIKLSPSKLSQMVVAKQKDVINIVDLGESSSEEDAPDASKVPPVTGDITASSGAANDAAPHVDVKSKPRTTSKNYGLNLDEISIKTRASATEPLAIPEVKTGEPTSEEKDMEVLTLDSDEDEHTKATEPTPPASKTEVDIRQNKCINSSCPSDMSAPICPADRLCVAYYEPDRKRKGFVCHECANAVAERTQRLIDGVRDFTPLLEMDMGRPCQDLVEISDSESDSEPEDSMADSSLLGVEEATQVEEKLVNMINATWEKFKMDARLDDTQAELNAELERLDKESKEIDEMLRECQAATDKLRSELYASFEPDTQSQPTLIIFDTPDTSFTKIEAAVKPEEVQNRELKRRLSSTSDISKPPSKRTSLPAPAPDTPSLPTDGANKETKADTTLPSEGPTTQADDDKDVSVVTLSAESAPADLPPAGELTRPPLRVGMAVYAMRNSFGTWLKARVVECIPKGSAASSTLFTMCRVKFESKNHKNQYKMLPARCLAYNEPADVRMTIGTRLVALFKDPINTSRREAYYSGIVAEVPNPVNNYRYLVFFDDGYAQYVQHADTRLVCECAARVWEEVHPFSREFVRQYLTAYPERPMVRLHTGQSLKTELNGKWWVSRVIKVDASLVQVHFEKDNRTEWIYRGSTRLAPLYLELQAAERHRARPMPRNRLQNKMNMPYVEYTRSDDASSKADAQAADQTQQEELRRAQRAVAKKSVGGPVVIAGVGGGVLAGGVGRVPPAAPPPPPSAAPDAVTSRVVYYTPKNAVRPYKMVPHNCGPKCKRTDVLKLHELRTYNPLAKPLLSGWERQLVRYKGHKEVVYRAPCGRRLRHIRELHRYLRLTQSDMGVDLFDFGPSTHCLAEFVLNKCIIAKKDLSNGKENVPVPCVNYYDNSLPEFCSYNTERTPTDGVPLNLDPDFLCGCDCTDDCEDKSKCACWQLTLEGARTIGLNPRHVGYSYKRLPEPLPSGIYECNSRCKCKSTCLNRVAQHPLQLKLQVFKTLNRGWGIRALNDVPKGAFLCVYAGNLLTDATANLDGLNEGDEYLAELDYIEVVEQMKEGYEEDIPEADRRMDKKELGEDSSTEEDSSEEEAPPSKDEKKDGDFQVMGPMNINSEFRKTLRKREKKEKKDEKDAAGNERNKDKDNGGGKDGDEDCITISDDEEVREPSRFAAQPGMGSEFVSKYKSVRSYFGKDEACYIMDAKVQGNIGRYLNHSCSPNVFVQNVFVDTHDPRFPWVAFFALLPIRAGTELTWNYNYDIGSVPGKVLYCYCGAANCRGRLL